MDFCDMLWRLRPHVFFSDRDITLQSDRVLVLGDGTEIPSSALVPIGAIVLWSGSVASIPTGWQITDGTNGTPDLRDKFVVGAGSTHNPGDTGGSDTVDLRHDHGDTDNESSHTHSVSITSNPDGAHSHALQAGTAIIDSTPGGDRSITTDVENNHDHLVSGTSGAGSAHSHNIPNALSATTENRPAFYALAFIQRIS